MPKFDEKSWLADRLKRADKPDDEKKAQSLYKYHKSGTGAFRAEIFLSSVVYALVDLLRDKEKHQQTLSPKELAMFHAAWKALHSAKQKHKDADVFHMDMANIPNPAHAKCSCAFIWRVVFYYKVCDNVSPYNSLLFVHLTTHFCSFILQLTFVRYKDVLRLDEGEPFMTKTEWARIVMERHRAARMPDVKALLLAGETFLSPDHVQALTQTVPVETEQLRIWSAIRLPDDVLSLLVQVLRTCPRWSCEPKGRAMDYVDVYDEADAAYQVQNSRTT
jgi:hypothetical protein